VLTVRRANGFRYRVGSQRVATQTSSSATEHITVKLSRVVFVVGRSFNRNGVLAASLYAHRRGCCGLNSESAEQRLKGAGLRDGIGNAVPEGSTWERSVPVPEGLHQN
jgi:hypothetical protein